MDNKPITNNCSEMPLNLPARTNQFDSNSWLDYFKRNKTVRPVFDWTEIPAIDHQLRLPLIRSLQRFQVGETGDGKHLRKYANGTGDQAYISCIDMFVKEEQEHARLLAKVIESMHGKLLQWHWTDFVFVLLRRLLGLKTEILILFVAEIIGKCFYEIVSKNCGDEHLSKLFAQIVRDEIGCS